MKTCPMEENLPPYSLYKQQKGINSQTLRACEEIGYSA
jgi:hypothetical protein